MTTDPPPSVEQVAFELKRMRQRLGLGHPAVVLELSGPVRRHLLGAGTSDHGDASDVVLLVTALRDAVEELGDHERLFMSVDFNLVAEHSYPTLTERRESLARHIKCAMKTVRRHADRALESLAVVLVSSRERGSSSAENVGDDEGVPLPWQLLPAPTQFTDRAGDLAELDRLATEGGRQRALIVITGPGGVGKTALASQWLHSRSQLFPDGVLQADLDAFTPGGPVAAGSVLCGFLRALGIASERIPADVPEQAKLFRSLTAGKALGVLLDDAASAAQVRPLLPASSASVTVVTSRRRLGGLVTQGARLIVLEPLGEPAAIELLTRSVGGSRVANEPDAARALVEMCGGMPIAVCVAAARLVVQPRRSIALAVDDLADQRRRLARLAVNGDVSVEATFDLSYRELPEQPAALYRMLALHPGAEFGTGVAAAAVDTTPEEAKDLLSVLVDMNMLLDVGADRFKFHDLIRLHARSQGDRGDSAPAREQAARRMLDWYLRTAMSANVVVIPLRWHIGSGYQEAYQRPPAFGGAKEAMAWLELERANLLAAVRLAAGNGWHEWTWQMCEALWELFLYRKHYGDWIWSHEVGVAAAVRCADHAAESRLRYQLGRGYLELRRFDEATYETELAVRRAQAGGHHRNESAALEQLGMAANGQGQPDKAIEYFRRSLAIERALGIRRGVALRLRRIGMTLTDVGRYDEAVEHLADARDLFVELADSPGEAETLRHLAAVYTRMGRLDVALTHLRAALPIMALSGSDVYHAQVLAALGDVSDQLGDGAARGYFRQALDLAEYTGGPEVDRLRARLAAYQATG
ncbi:ATP-binding protein [Actinocrispum wychmicini]|uniref:ATP-binding protein n=1 Tax=Actinocrispum wychmicini TaxID=1213861 RepID=UPI00104C2252|nr:tetratricopeptide repeat protein [Actinocrispum wychmicini]